MQLRCAGFGVITRFISRRVIVAPPVYAALTSRCSLKMERGMPFYVAKRVGDPLDGRPRGLTSSRLNIMFPPNQQNQED
jgi:hypothetical protein